MTVGLFGGSFNPPHDGHVHVCETALYRLELDRVWWIVSPGNPLKDHSELAPLEERVQLSREINSNPRIEVTAFEAQYRSRYTADTLSFLKKRMPGVHFVWVMGADNLASFHKWERWRDIAEMMPMAVIDRPGSTLSYRSAKGALALSRYRVDESDASLLPRMKPPAWTFLHGPRSSLSSTAIRQRNKALNGL